ncbi:MAG: hypothetical protein U0R19_20225 [Bryobacteraceae bacterium]
MPGNWNAAPQVTAIYSVSSCINDAPQGWLKRWLHNDWGFYNSHVDGRSVIPPNENGFEMLAYRLLPVRFHKGHTEPLSIDGVAPEPLPPTYRSAGFDVVNKTYSAFFECSPLSCNSLAKDIPVNSCCLVNTLDEAIAVARKFSVEEPEPGPYFVIEVLRESVPA